MEKKKQLEFLNVAWIELKRYDMIIKSRQKSSNDEEIEVDARTVPVAPVFQQFR